MKINNLLFPIPVLGQNDDYTTGSFSCELSVTLDPKNINLKINYKLNQKTIQKLIDSRQACFVTEVHCNKTFFRKSYINMNSINIDSVELRNSVDVSFWIIANTDLKNIELADINSDYGKSLFNIEKSEILAFGGRASFIADKTWEDLKAIKSFMEIQINPDKDAELAEVLITDDKIIVLLSKKMHKDFAHAQGNEDLHGILHSSLVLPALIMAINKSISYDYKNSDEQPEWFRIIEARFNEIGLLPTDLQDIDKTFNIAQRLIDNPLSRELRDINNLTTSLYGSEEIEL